MALKLLRSFVGLRSIRGALRGFHSGAALSRFNQPLSAQDMPRAGGIATMMRLPLQDNQPEGLDVCFVGIPFDIASSAKPGTRMAPRAIRTESPTLKPCNMNGAAPFESLQVADIGDVPVNTYSVEKTFKIITDYFRRITKANCTPLVLGGDHSITLPILRALKEKHGQMGMIQIDAHADLTDSMFGEKYTHSTPFRRALEEGLLSPKHMVQIGLRGGTYSASDFEDVYKWGQQQGIRMVFDDQCWHKSLTPLMDSVREQMGDMPVYFTFDIDGVDAAFCPGTSVREPGGLSMIQALEVVRGCRGLNLIGADLVEVNPFLDPNGMTATAAGNFLFELLCVLPGVKYYDLS